MKKIINSYQLGDMCVCYVTESENASGCGLLLYPAALENQVSLDGDWNVDNLVQVKTTGDAYPAGFSHGHTMRNSQTTEKLHFVGQTSSLKDSLLIETIMESDNLRAVHKLTYRQGVSYFEVATDIENISTKRIQVEMLSSFSICGLSPLGSEERMEDMNLYRLRSKWSAEGRLEKSDFVSLQMEPSWQRYGVQSIRYGEVGSMPVRGFFPWVAVEDTRYHMMVGAQLFHNSSWQIELYSRDERAALSGGLANREFGHWMKTLEPGEVLHSPRAVLSTCTGDVDELSWRLTQAQKEGRKNVPEIDKNLPILFNEFCTT